MPALQLSQLDALVDEKVPAAQLVHALALEAEYVPALHALLTEDRPMVAQILPDGQLLQLDEPSIACMKPFPQLVQVTAATLA